MDRKSQSWLKCLLFFGLPLVFLALGTWLELDFALEGRFAEAVVTGFGQYTPQAAGCSSRGVRSPPVPKPSLIINYCFVEDSGAGRTYKEYRAMDDASAPKIGDNISVEYLPGAGNAVRRADDGDGSHVLYAFIILLSIDVCLFYYNWRSRSGRGDSAYRAFDRDPEYRLSNGTTSLKTEQILRCAGAFDTSHRDHS